MSKTTKGLSSYTDSDETKLETAKDKIRWLLARRTGKDTAISSQALADAVGIAPSTARSLVRQLRRDADIPIGSVKTGNRTGYYRITSVDDLEEHFERIQGRINEARELKENLAAAYNKNNV